MGIDWERDGARRRLRVSERAGSNECYFFSPPTHTRTYVHMKRYRYVLREMRAQKFYCITFSCEWQIRNERRVSIRFLSDFRGSDAGSAVGRDECACMCVSVPVRASYCICICDCAKPEYEYEYEYECLLPVHVSHYTNTRPKRGVVCAIDRCVCICVYFCVQPRKYNDKRNRSLSLAFVLFIFSIRLCVLCSSNPPALSLWKKKRFSFQFHFVSAWALSLTPSRHLCRTLRWAATNKHERARKQHICIASRTCLRSRSPPWATPYINKWQLFWHFVLQSKL